MNEAQKKKAELVEEARQETGAAGDARKYSLRGARLAIQRKEAAIQKRSEKITQLQLENQQDKENIRTLRTICAEIQAQEVKRKLTRMQSKGATVETEQINRALELLALVGDAMDAMSVQQMAEAVQGAASHASEIAADAQEAYEKTVSRPVPEDSESAE